MDIGEKSREKLRVFVKKQLLAIQQDMLQRLPENTAIDLPDIPQVLVDQALEVYIGTANRQLFDFFDENKIIITIDHDEVREQFLPVVSGLDYPTHSFVERKEAEKEGFAKAFKILEQL